MRIPARHPDAPQSELSEYYLSYGSGRHHHDEDRRDLDLDDDYYPWLSNREEQDHAYDDYDEDEYGNEEYDENESYLSWLVANAVETLTPVVNEVEESAVRWMSRWSTRLAEISLGVIYIWFGALKFVPDLSPAEGLVRATVGEISGAVGIPLPTTPVFILLAIWEVMIGIGFIVHRYRRAAVWMLIAHIPATTLPFLLLPDLVWTHVPLGLSLEGQYIVKNLALLSGALAVGAATRSGFRRPEAGP